MHSATLKGINERFLIGDRINDNELDAIHLMYTRLERDLKILGPHFHLAWDEVNRRLLQCEKFRDARLGLFKIFD